MLLKSQFVRIKNDLCGNPRYKIDSIHIDPDFNKAYKIANKSGGKKIPYKQSFIFQSFNLQDTINCILKNSCLVK